ncbi:hypothetical protein KSF_111530 [Reticulibacter mediterranei]|uniref:Uncharacterized protein n=1 Tax=Reticulibacter mediterranei TaxID=2778369 RepID=A0A8J3IZ11_9CHLR|nr:hypothetical protein KSF_111530 [Reticulibacter mediterranei]
MGVAVSMCMLVNAVPSGIYHMSGMEVNWTICFIEYQNTELAFYTFARVILPV